MSTTIPYTDRWLSYYMGMAFLTAMQSKDYSTQVGCVIVGPNREIRSMGFNGPPRAFPDTHPALFTSQKNQYMIHAEDNAFNNAGRAGTPVVGCDLFVTLRPCSGCALKIANAGIKNIFYHGGVQDYYESLTESAWSWEVSDEVFNQAGITQYRIDSELAVPFSIRVRGNSFTPCNTLPR